MSLAQVFVFQPSRARALDARTGFDFVGVFLRDMICLSE